MVHLNKFKASRSRVVHPFIPVSVNLVLSSEQVNNDGVLSVRQCYKSIDPRDISKCNAVDFCLQNQIVIGSVEKLRPVTLVGDDVISLSSKIPSFESQIVNVIEESHE